MKFGRFPIGELEGAILAHSILIDGTRMAKGRVLTASDIYALDTAGIAQVMAAIPEDGDVSEDHACQMIANKLLGQNMRASKPVNGRINIHAERAGQFRLDARQVSALNRLDEGIGVATLPDATPVSAGQLLATIKTIPFAVPKAALDAAPVSAGVFSLLPFIRQRPILILSQLEQSANSSKPLRKTEQVTRQRLARYDINLPAAILSAHDEDQIAAAIHKARNEGSDLILIMGATATVDRRDVIPSAILQAGGRINRFGIPMDPGNLLLLAQVDDCPIIGMPGCARSPQENGFDKILGHILAGDAPDAIDVAGLGVGGLLKEPPGRPQPREAPTIAQSANTACMILAAGRSQRMGNANKLLAPINGKPMLQHVVDLATSGGFSQVILVSGHDAKQVTDALSLGAVRPVHNPDYASGMASSLQAGIGALDENAGDCLVLLGDMPFIKASTIQALMDTARDNINRIIVPVMDGRRGNPVILPRCVFASLGALTGDAGARQIMRELGDEVIEVAVDDPAIFADIDTLDALKALGGKPSS